MCPFFERKERHNMSIFFSFALLFTLLVLFPSIKCQIIDGVISARSLRHEVVHPTKTCLDGSCQHVQLSLSTFGGQKYKFLLVRNEELLADDYFEQIDDEEPVRPFDGRSAFNEETNCYYQSWDQEITAAVSFCNKTEGIFTLDNESFLLQFDHELNGHCIFRYHDLPQSDWSGESIADLVTVKEYADKYLTRLLPVGRTLVPKRPEMKYLEVLYIMDKAMFVQRLKSNRTEASALARTLVNYVGREYRNNVDKNDVMNFHIVLKGLIIWEKKDPFKPSPSIQFHLIEFLNYNFEHIYPVYEQDHAVLITGRTFPDSLGIVGIALRSSVCMRPELAAVLTVLDEQQTTRLSLVSTIAHETGHSLGFWDERYQNDWNCQGAQNVQNCLDGCPGDNCIMRSCLVKTGKIHSGWSRCTRKQAAKRWNDGRYFCLGNRPFHRNTSIEAISSCGNGVIEYGEECDCSIGDNVCRDVCCDMKKCKLRNGAKCSSGKCCLDCHIRNKGHKCREKQDDFCDLEDTCDGSSEICFNNILDNRTSCDSTGDKWCKMGKCTLKCFKNCFGHGSCQPKGDRNITGHECKCEGLYYGKFCQFRFGVTWHIVLGCILGGISCTITSIVFALQDRYFNKDQIY